MKILFLDIDGVLNSFDNMIASGNVWQLNNQIKSRDQFGMLFDNRCVNWLTYIKRI